MKRDLLEILKKVKIVSLATLDERGNPWICNVHFGVDENMNLYIVSKKDSNHSKHIEDNGKIAFTIFTFNLQGKNDKASLQAKGSAKSLSNTDEISIGAKAIAEKFPNWILKPEELVGESNERRMYKITPTYIKHLDDILLGNDVKEYFEADLKTS